MLVLSRKAGEKITVGDEISFTILEIGRGKVRVGIDAPREVKIMRSEVDTKGERAEAEHSDAR